MIRSPLTDTLIIGGGVIGLSLAWELSKRGKQVLILESERVGGAASWAGAGILPPPPTRNIVDPYDRLKLLSHQLHSQWAKELTESTGIDTGYQQCGGIYLAKTVGEFATLKANESWWHDHGIQYLALGPQELCELEPNLVDLCREGLLAAWRLPAECQLRNPHHLQALAVACRNNGVRILEGSQVVGFEQDGQRVSQVLCADGSSLIADQFCICSGAWARQLLEPMDVATGIMPIRGQMVLYRFDIPPFTQVINEGNRYLVPRRDGLLLAGSVEEEVGYRCETTPEAIGQIRRWAESIFPKLHDHPIEKSWAGLRPGAFDGLPYLGSVPAYKNLFLAAGHFRSGLHLSCGTARCLADVMTGQESPVDLFPFRVGRG